MYRWLPLLVVVLFASACSAEPTTTGQEAGELVFGVDTSQPISVPDADSPSNSADTSTNGNPPERLAFGEWTVDELITALERALDGPTTVTFSGQGSETLQLNNSAWQVKSNGSSPGSEATQKFTIRGFGDDEWVTYEHVGLGIRSFQSFTASTDDQDTGTPDETLQRFQLDRFVLDETRDLQTTWIPHRRNGNSFFVPSVLSPRFVEELLTDVAAAVAAADIDGILETEATESTFVATIADSDVVDVAVEGDEITLSSRGGWTVTVSPGIDDTAELGPPNPRDLLTRELLLTATSIPDECVSMVITARELVDNGIVSCTDQAQLDGLIAALPTAEQVASATEDSE